MSDYTVARTDDDGNLIVQGQHGGYTFSFVGTPDGSVSGEARHDSVEPREPKPVTTGEIAKVVAPAPSTPPQPKGPGDHLHDVIVEATGIEPTVSCGCEAMIALMNQMGVEFCEAGREIIIGRMVEQGKQQLTGVRRAIAFHLPGGERLATWEAAGMFDEAMRRARHGKTV